MDPADKNPVAGRRTRMSPEDAFEVVRTSFPFRGYMQGREHYLDIARTVTKYLPVNSHILDFGSGPCDKTAVVQNLGYRCVAFDDLNDNWHTLGDNRRRIMAFAAEMGVEFKLATDEHLPFRPESFDMIMSHDVLEHLHSSPRDLFGDLLTLVKPLGYIFVTVPNAVNLRKRIHVLFGRTNLPPYASYFWYPGVWRGHVREYVRNDLVLFSKFLNLEISELRSCHHMLSVLPKWLVPFYRGITSIFTACKDSWLLVAKKPPQWTRKEVNKNEIEARFAPPGTV